MNVPLPGSRPRRIVKAVAARMAKCHARHLRAHAVWLAAALLACDKDTPVGPEPEIGVESQPVAAGTEHTCALTVGRTYCWGNNSFGQLGTASNVSSEAPTEVAGGLRFVALAAGPFHTCGLTGTGAAYCWGRNANGELGNQTTHSSNVPIRVTGTQKFTALAAGGDHVNANGQTCALSDQGVTYCWGAGIARPTLRSSAPHFTSIDLGSHFGCAASADGSSYCWGQNDYGQLGVGDRALHSDIVPVASDIRLDKLAAGWAHVCGLTASRVAYCWGHNSAGQLGIGTATGPEYCEGAYTGPQYCSFTPVAVQATQEWSRLAAGAVHTCAVAMDGAAWCWGFNREGQLGDGTTTPSTLPKAVSGELTFATVTAGSWHTCGVAGGQVYCWGHNYVGQLGDGSTIERHAPTRVNIP